jgi:hypothetical protein
MSAVLDIALSVAVVGSVLIALIVPLLLRL